MKFGRLLRDTAYDLPHIQSLYSRYKRMKKELKRSSLSTGISDTGAQCWTPDENWFVESLTATLHELNDTFIEREEESIIVLHDLEASAAACEDADERRQLYRNLVDFHGQLLLLMHWSVLAYTTVVKILKKYHKKTGLLVRAPHLGNLLAQPFCSTEDLSNLISKAEAWIHELGPKRPDQHDLSSQCHLQPANATAQAAAMPTSSAQQGTSCTAAGVMAGRVARSMDARDAVFQSDCDSCSLPSSASQQLLMDVDSASEDLDASEMEPELHTSGAAPQLSNYANCHDAAAFWHGPVVQQTQVALTTWIQLWRTAATPSTVFSGRGFPGIAGLDAGMTGSQ